MFDLVKEKENYVSPLRIFSIYQDRFGQMLLATDKGLISFNEAENIWQFYDSENSNLFGDIVTAIMEDRSGRIWLGTDKGIMILDK